MLSLTGFISIPLVTPEVAKLRGLLVVMPDDC